MARNVRRRPLVAAATALALTAGTAIAAGPPAGATPTGQPSFHLDRVSCVSATFCMAVGSRGHRMNGIDNSSKTLIERWNGSKWSIIASPNGPAGTSTTLNDVSCTGAAWCMAVGTAGTKTFAARWAGSKWLAVTSVTPANVQYASLTGVSCRNYNSSSSCVAVGTQYTPDGRGPTLMERWNGIRWSMLHAPTPDGNNPVSLGSVSCPQATNCYAVGSFDLGGPGRPAALIVHWNGTSFSLAYPGTSTEVSSLNGVSCVNPPNCTAVGSAQTVYPSFGPIATLVVHWNGTKWSRRSSPSPGDGLSQLGGISCISTTQCTAVGQMATASGRRTLAERGNGPAWSQVTSANAPAPAASGLSGVSCRSAAYCIAVGASELQSGTPSEYFNTLAEKWNGTKWTITPGPAPSAS